MSSKKHKDGNVSENILYVLKTKQNANELLNFVDILCEETHKTGSFDVEKVASETFVENKYRPSWSDVLIRSLDNSISRMDVVRKGTIETNRGGVINTKVKLENVRSFLGSVEDLIRNAELIKVEVPFIPSEEFVGRVYELFRESGVISGSEDSFLLDIRKIKKGGDPKIFVRGKCIDLNIKKFIMNYLLSKDVINRYL